MEVAIEKSIVAAFLFPDKVGQGTYIREVAMLEKENSFFKIKSLVVSHFLGNKPMIGPEITIVQKGRKLFDATHGKLIDERLFRGLGNGFTETGVS